MPTFRLPDFFAALALFFAAICEPAAGEVLLDLRAPSPALKRDIHYSLYRPAAEPARGKRWPVLYLLHGLGDNELTWPELGLVGETLDYLIRTGQIEPILVVMPRADSSWYVNNPDPGGAGLVAEALTRDLVDHIDQTYPTTSCRAGRAVGGLSMGGYGALLYAMDNPDRYAAAFSFSGSLFRPMPTDEAERAKRATRMFNVAFGNPFDWQRFNSWNLFPRLPRYVADSNRSALYLAIGDNDFPNLKTGNVAFSQMLTEAGIPTPLHVDEGGHVWSLWAKQLGPALKWLNSKLTTACPP